MLQLSGCDISEDEGTGGIGGVGGVGGIGGADEELLDEVMEAREIIEGAAGEGDLEALRGVNEGRIQRSEKVLGGLFEGGDLKGARGEVVRLRYWVNIREALEGWERGKGVVVFGALRWVFEGGRGREE